MLAHLVFLTERFALYKNHPLLLFVLTKMKQTSIIMVFTGSRKTSGNQADVLVLLASNVRVCVAMWKLVIGF